VTLLYFSFFLGFIATKLKRNTRKKKKQKQSNPCDVTFKLKGVRVYIVAAKS
jgi:hypothetical protein